MLEKEGGVVIVVALHHLPVLSLSGRSLVLSLSTVGGGTGQPGALRRLPLGLEPGSPGEAGCHPLHRVLPHLGRLGEPVAHVEAGDMGAGLLAAGGVLLHEAGL